MQSDQLLVRHLIDLVHFSLCICGNELLDNHESTTDTDDQLSIQNLRVNLLCSEQIETIANLPNRNWTVGLIDVMAKHLIKQVTLRKLEHWSLLLVANLHVHYLNDLVLVLEQCLHFLDLVDLLRHRLRQVVQSFQEDLLVFGEPLNISIKSLNVTVEVRDLRLLQLDLLVQINFLLSDDI